MKNLTKTGIIIFCVVFCGGINVFAQPADMQAIRPEFQKMDINKDGFVTSEEMQAYQAKRFNELDKNKDGKITPEESSSQFKEYFRQMDKNKDGKISEAEYTDYWKGIYYF